MTRPTSASPLFFVLWAHFLRPFAAKNRAFRGFRPAAARRDRSAPLQKQIRRICAPLRGSTSGKPEVNVIQVWSFAPQNSGSNCCKARFPAGNAGNTPKFKNLHNV
jgi:hypothetical protein